MNPLRRLFLAPEPLLLLIVQAITSFAQPNLLVINQSLPLDTLNLPSSTFALPQSPNSQLTISVALCDAAPLDSNANNARFFATNNSAVNDPGPDSTESDVYEITLGSDGIGNITLLGNVGGVFSVSVGGSQQRFEVGVSDAGKSVVDENECRMYSMFEQERRCTNPSRHFLCSETRHRTRH